MFFERVVNSIRLGYRLELAVVRQFSVFMTSPSANGPENEHLRRYRAPDLNDVIQSLNKTILVTYLESNALVN